MTSISDAHYQTWVGVKNSNPASVWDLHIPPKKTAIDKIGFICLPCGSQLVCTLYVTEQCRNWASVC